MGDRFNRNVLFTCLGSPGKPVVDTVGPLLMQSGDRLLLCSDGLSDVVDDATIAATLQDGSRAHCAQRLIDLALAAGGRDNISAIVADVAPRVDPSTSW